MTKTAERDSVQDQLCARIDELEHDKEVLAAQLDRAEKRLADGHYAPIGWVGGDRYEMVSREKMDYRRRWKEACEERDALAAHMEACREAFENLSEYWNGGEDMAAEDAAQHAMDVSCDMLEGWPTTSLARLKAQWQAEALEALWPRLVTKADQQITRHTMRELRRQAEGGDHED